MCAPIVCLVGILTLFVFAPLSPPRPRVHIMASPPSVYEPFPVLSDPSTLGLRWPPYLRRLENMFTGFAITDSSQKKSLLLYYSGVEVSDIFYTLTVASGEGVDVYKAATDALTAHFAPSKNTEYERFLFRDAKQNPGETMDAFHTRLQRIANRAVFMIRTQK